MQAAYPLEFQELQSASMKDYVHLYLMDDELHLGGQVGLQVTFLPSWYLNNPGLLGCSRNPRLSIVSILEKGFV
jgi:hypothetical protein